MMGRSRSSPALMVASIMDRPFSPQLHGKGHPEHRIFCTQADEHQKADLEIDVIFKAPHPVENKRARECRRARRS